MSGQSIGEVGADIYKRAANALTVFIYDKNESFSDMKKQQDVPPLINQIMTAIYAVSFVLIIATLILASGAAHLSMCYKSYMGVTSQTSILFSATIAFIFFPLYYPYYAFVLNPLCTKGKVVRR